jgi:hypothetical protein
MKKSELLNWLQEEYQKWEALLNQIGPTRMDQPGVNSEWSMKDMVAHLTGWNQWLVARLQAAQRGEPEPPPPWPADRQSEDEINAWIYESNHGRSVREVLDEAHRQHQQLLAGIEALPADVHMWTINASPLVSFLTISMMTMSRMYALGWRELL